MITSNKYLFKAFTLVELIVVIVILSILATIAFMSFGSQSSSARDSTRLSDVAQLSKWLWVKSINSWTYPLPDSKVMISSWSTTLGYQGYAWDSVKRMLNANTDTFKDPLDKSDYTYVTNAVRNKHQLLAFLENKWSISFDFGVWVIWDWTEALTSYTSRYPYTKWDALWVILSTTWSTTSPTYIPLQDTSVTWSILDVTNTWNTVWLVAITSASSTDTAATSTWVTTTWLSGYSSVVSASTSSNTCNWPVPSGWKFWTWTIGMPTSQNQEWTYSPTPWNCTYTCIDWYTWNWCLSQIWSNSNNPWSSCLEIKNLTSTTTDWIYWINPIQTSTWTIQVYCDMNTDWWGWTLIFYWNNLSSAQDIRYTNLVSWNIIKTYTSDWVNRPVLTNWIIWNHSKILFKWWSSTWQSTMWTWVRFSSLVNIGWNVSATYTWVLSSNWKTSLYSHVVWWWATADWITWSFNLWDYWWISPICWGANNAKWFVCPMFVYSSYIYHFDISSHRELYIK